MDTPTPKFEAWRQAERLSYMEIGRRIGCSDVTARRFALGIRQPDAVTAERIVAATGGAVTVLDLHEARLAYERAGAPQVGEGGGEAGCGEAASGHGASVPQADTEVSANGQGDFA